MPAFVIRKSVGQADSMIYKKLLKKKGKNK